MYESCHRLIHVCDMTHTYHSAAVSRSVTDVTHINDSWMSRVSHMTESCHRSNQGGYHSAAMAHSMSHAPHMNESRMSHVSRMNESCHRSNQGGYHSAATLRGRAEVRDESCLTYELFVSHI